MGATLQRVTEREIAGELELAGFIVDYDARSGWFVGLGSHGDCAPTLRKAVKRCLRCCGIGDWWQLRRVLAKEVAKEIFESKGIGWMEHMESKIIRPHAEIPYDDAVEYKLTWG